jgi:hypothetical protein
MTNGRSEEMMSLANFVRASEATMVHVAAFVQLLSILTLGTASHV